MIIAIDGPSGAGKSTVAKAVAQRLGFGYLDTGAMYRAVAYEAVKKGLDLEYDAALGALARSMTIAFERPAATDAQAAAGTPAGVEAFSQKVLADGEDVTSAIRTGEIDRAVSPVSAAPSVREAMTAQQRTIGSSGDYVVEGRDIATTVFPNAEVKVFLTASAEERARRRQEQNRQRGVGSTDYDELLADLQRRDEYDSSRAASPLAQAADARLLDSTNLSQEEVIERIAGWARDVRSAS